MDKKRATKKRWIVHRKFEPNRLSAEIMMQAYAQIIPPQVRVVRLGINKVGEEGSQCAGSNRHPEPSLVIDPITKKEAA